MGFFIHIKLITISLLLFHSLLVADESYSYTTLNETKDIYENQNTLFIDIRESHKFLKATISGAVNIPIDKYEVKKKFLPSQNISIVIFAQNSQSTKPVELSKLLNKDGYKNIYLYPGGFDEWQKNSLTMVGQNKKCEESKLGIYKPKTKPIFIKGAKIYKGIEGRMIDQFWFSDMIVNNTIDKNIQLVDIRQEGEYKKGHISGAINIVWDSKKKKLDYKKFPKDKVVILYCNTGMQSADTISSFPKYIQNELFYLDANIECIKNDCKITPNENL